MKTRTELEDALEPDLDDVADRFLRKAFRSSPWFFVSLVFHGLVLACFPLIMLTEELHEAASTPVTISLDAQRIDPERPRRLISSGPPSAEGEGLDEPPIFFPDAKAAERNESANADDRHAIKGEAFDVLTHVGGGSDGPRGRLLAGPPGTNDIMGVGGGAGTGRRFGGLAGGRADLVARGGGSAATEAAVEAGLAWLAGHQVADGHWSSANPRCQSCDTHADLESVDVGTTALATLAFMTAGYTPSCGAGAVHDRATGKTLHYGDTVRSALKWLAFQEEKDGRFQGPWATKDENQIALMYNQAFGTLAFCEAYRLTHDASYKTAAESALAWLEQARNPASGWRYKPRCGDSDVSVTGACIQALRGARLAGLPVHDETLAGAGTFLGNMTDEGGSAGYTEGRSRLGASLPAIGVYIQRVIAPGRKPRSFDLVSDTIERNVIRATGYAPGLKEAYPSYRTDYYLWYYAMLSLFDVEGPSGVHFRSVNQYVTTELVKLQRRRSDGCAEGSWDAGRDWYMHYAGRTCATALNVLTLEVYYRYVTLDPK